MYCSRTIPVSYQVMAHIYALHSAATPGFFDLLAAALVTEATDENGEPTRASKYLANTLNRGRHGSPCVAMETPKMRGTQVRR